MIYPFRLATAPKRLSLISLVVDAYYAGQEDFELGTEESCLAIPSKLHVVRQMELVPVSLIMHGNQFTSTA